MRRFRPAGKAPLALAGFLSLPLFFAALMAASLAIEKPKAYEWQRHGRLFRTFHDATGANEAKIWALAIAVGLSLVAIGWLASYLRYGLYVTCAAAIAEALALTVRLPRWERHHTARFPFGEDLYPDSSTSSLVARGQWEHNAAETVRSLVHYTVGLALVATAIVVFLAVRRNRGGTIPTASSELQQTGGAPTTSA